MERKLALITGASAGIGAAFARLLAGRGYDVALTARRADRLEALAAELKARFAVEALTVAADLARADGPARIMSHVADRGRHVDVLINNAGYGLPGGYVGSRWEDQAAFIQLMTTAPADLAHRLLPGMVERRFGRIINVASLAGIIPGSPGHTLYGASKAFMIRMSQSLNLEVRGTGVHVTALCPGLTHSEFHDVNGTREKVTGATPTWLWQRAETVALAGYAAVEANRAVVVTGAPNKAIAALCKVVPEPWLLALMASQGRRFRRL